MISGILNVNKEVGISSNKCVSLVKKALDIKKVGHTGTLDLEAYGVLPIVIGKATRVSDYLMDDKKEYITEAVFGKRTDTLDYSGEVLDTSDIVFDKDQLLEVMEGFKGEITQIPPMYSAIKVNGQKLYDLARNGVEIERKVRKVNIYEFELLEYEFPKAKFKIICSKGTYIRTLIDDLGEKLGSFAYVDSLCRSKVGDFYIEDSIKSQNLLSMDKDQLLNKLDSVDSALNRYKKVILPNMYYKQAINGMTMLVENYYGDELVRVYIGDEFIGLAKSSIGNDRNFLKMDKVFYER
ncbi:MAG: tRNA pseudouridine(55) synthase TruB [Anaerococcus sp.]|uniref:tRNA pseudouridine synthase B n=1 Tax=Anaerococcus nagyae TaxID=1755241 RepID=A0A3E2TJA6_9FIRM|nr:MULTISPECIES: tRNA pseudouridine(55) synthase TruB [Anaerococcus]MDU2353088.1 tRNA pseudouridine(55) synthase TruB [Anaerococcus sp.]MDU2566186.1 tRNA pseudouridine(55) synthase TruB [Anaerococcus sp.]RGB77066.1 tRNA pseudouridine(55) synthase TruB [Anaerococcus nagyae]